MNINAEQKKALANCMQEFFPLKSDFDRAMLDFEKRIGGRTAASRPLNDFSISKWVRGMVLAQRHPVIPGSVDPESDLNYFTNTNDQMVQKDLNTTATPGSYLVPSIQADEIVAMLADYGALRRAGCRVIPMVGIDKLNLPVALGYPTVQWLGQNTAQSASDANLGQVALALKTCRSLTPVPNELLSVSVPAIDMILSEIMAIGGATAEDQAFFSTVSVTNGPASIYSQIAALTKVMVGGSANGGSLTYQDLLNVLGASRKAKAVGPFVWFTNPYTLYNVVSGLIDKNSRPLFDPNAVVQKLFGWPIVDTTWLGQDQANGSGTNQSYLIFTNPKYILIGEPGSIELAASSEWAFDKNQTTLRMVKRLDFGIAPPLGVTILAGIQ